MLVCVKTLVDVRSFEDARNSKEWLTTSETWQYIIQHSAPATMYLYEGGSYYYHDEDKSWDERWAKYKMLKEQFGRWCGGTPYQTIYQQLPHMTTQDNAGAKVKFYNIADIMSFVEGCDKREAARKKRVVQKRAARIRAACGRSAAINKSSKYNEKKSATIQSATLLHGSFYDPEWFN